MPATVTVWEKDPALAARIITVPAPDIAKTPLAFHLIPSLGDNPPKAVEFRYWNAAATLRRAADFWAASSQPPVKWRGGQVMDVFLDRGEALNSEYDGVTLSFYHGSTAGHPTLVVYSGESPDLLCHELGHAVLDAIRSDLFEADELEVKAFGESFGDMSAVLCAMQLPTFCSFVLAEILGRDFWSSSSLSRVGQQFGSALRLVKPADADVDCLRNAWNNHFYIDPAQLSQVGLADAIWANAHSFSRIFTGAFFEALSGMLSVRAGTSLEPETLRQVSDDMRDILVGATRRVQLVPRFAAEIAAAMVEESDKYDHGYPNVFQGVFVRRNILPQAIS
ncbi:hypothetical protein [Rhizobium mesoamericanum]|uniref:Uncharacterized protein n=1 Tax=Rhizobium mesoamericanum STM3625 TaxID=1211777 RepID=K0Q314_9HYPH|nr:hypothetical protein [Rhizobium mesoamericanum]CCM79125.1 conserved hypothetical protein [Rhizobium mesoamericanum STM3625]